MALFSLNKDWVRNGTTSLSNTFILDIMPCTSNADYIKVYLYCLMYAQANSDDVSIDSIASALGFEKEYVLKAISFWERRNLIVRLQDKPLKFELVPSAIASLSQDDDKEFELFKDALFGIFNEKRKLHGGEYRIAYEWHDELGFPIDIIMLFIQHMISTKGINFSFNTANKEITKLKSAGVRNYDEAEHYFTVQENYAKGAKAIYNRFRRYSKNPTEDEINLYAKWIKDYGLSHEDIIAACAETTKGEASFAYLDAIIKGIVSRRKDGSQSIKQSIKDEQKENESVKSILSILGIRFNSALNDPILQLLDKYGHDMTKFAAENVALSGGKINEMTTMLEYLSKNNINSVKEAKALLNENKILDKTLRAIYDRLALNMSPNSKDRQILKQWKKIFGDEIILKAADFSNGKKEPMAYMNAILKSWETKGYDSIDKINIANTQHISSIQNKDAGKKLIHQNYTQRQYSEEDYNVYIPNFSNEVKND